MKESLYHLDTRCVFRETFNSVQDIYKNGGVPNNLTLRHGVGYFENDSYIDYKDMNRFILNRSKSFRFKLTPNQITNSQFIYRNGGSSQATPGIYIRFTNYVTQVVIGNGTDRSTSTFSRGAITIDKEVELVVIIDLENNTKSLYVDGEFMQSLDLGIPGSFVNTNTLALGSNTFLGSMDLFEVYNGVLTADEVAGLYNNRLYRKVTI